jgi:TPR repeat protein
MGIGTRRDPLEANVWYVRASDHGDERARARLRGIMAATSTVDESKKAPRRMRKAQTLPVQPTVQTQAVQADGEPDKDKDCILM